MALLKRMSLGQWSTGATALLGMLLLAGCKVGPDYHAPRLPEAGGVWRADEGGDVLHRRAEDLALWWHQFEDPQLNRLVETLVSENLTLAQARERIIESGARRGVANAARLPQVDAQGEVAHTGSGDDALTMSGFPPGWETNLYTAGVMAGWEIDLWGRVARLVEAAEADTDAAIEDYRGIAVSLTAELALAYIDVQTLEARLEVVDRNVELQRRTLRLVEDLYQAGSRSELDVAQTRRLLQRTLARRPALRQARFAAENRIAVLLGKAPEDGIVTAGAMPQLPETVGLGLPAQLLTRRADVRRAERRYAASVARIGAAEAERFPRLTLAGSFSLQSNDPGGLLDESFVYSVGPKVSLPLFTGGRIDRNIDVRASVSEQARLGLERTLLGAISEVETAASGVVETRDRVTELQAAVDAARRSVELADELYRSGLSDLLQVIDAQRELVAVEDDLLVARQEALAETVRLYRALGGGWEVIGLDGSLATSRPSGTPTATMPAMAPTGKTNASARPDMKEKTE